MAEVPPPEEELEERVRRIVSEELVPPSPIALDERFTDRGVDSLLAIRIVGRLRQDLRTPLTTAALFQQPTPRLLAKHLDEVRASGQADDAIEPLPSREGALAVSFEQQAIWFHEQLSPKDQTNAHDQDMLRLDLARRLDRGALEHAIAAMIERHEILRTTYESAGGLPKQRVNAAPPIAIAYSAAQNDVELEAISRATAALRCDLKRGPLLRAHLVTLNEERHVLFVKIHHIAFDGWSANLFARELSITYEAHVAGVKPTLPALPLQYADHAAHQRHSEETGRLAPALAWWKERLGSAPASNLPTDQPRPKRATYRATSLRWELESSLARSLREQARREGVTLYTLLASAVACVVARAVSSEDVVLGMLTAGRADRQVHDLIGCFLNVLPLRLDVGGRPKPSELVQRTKRAIDDAFAHDVPFDTLLRALARPRTEGPLFEVSVVMEVPVAHTEGDAFTVDWVLNDHDPATAPMLVFMFIEHGDRLTCRIVYKRDLFDEARIGRLRAHLIAILAAVGAGRDDHEALSG